MTEQELAEKLLYWVQMARLSHAIAGELEDDYCSRVIGRSVFLNLYVILTEGLAGQLMNALKKRGVDVSNEEAAIQRLSGDFAGYYDTIRHKVGAHRQELPLLDLLTFWNDIDQGAMQVFVDDLVTVYDGLAANVAGAAPYSELPEASDAKLMEKLKASAAPYRTTVPAVAADILATTRENTVSFIACHPIQEKGQMVASALDMVGIEFALRQGILQWKETSRLLKWLIAVDLISLVDNMYGDSTGSPHVEKPLTKMFQEEGFKGAATMQRAAKARDLKREQKIREVRNKFGTHVDRPSVIGDVQAKVDAMSLVDLASVKFQLEQTFQTACIEDMRSRMFLLQRQPLKGGIGVENPEPKKPFRW